MKLPHGLTEDMILASAENSMVSLENPGFCLACGCETDGCEPDARNYKCDACGKRKVFGAEQILIMIGV